MLKGEIITWRTDRYGGTLFASTLDPIVEDGIQQIRHLDNYVDKLTTWLSETTPEGRLHDPSAYGVVEFPATRPPSQTQFAPASRTPCRS